MPSFYPYIYPYIYPCQIHTSTWVFSCKFAAYFQNTFSWELLWMAASERSVPDLRKVFEEFSKRMPIKWNFRNDISDEFNETCSAL